jgi:hypothetical protein
VFNPGSVPSCYSPVAYNGAVIEPLTSSIRTVDGAGLYSSVMGTGWAELAEPIRFFHSARSVTHARGRFRVARGANILARLMASAMRLPREAAASELTLTIERDGRRERWERAFGGQLLVTTQELSETGALLEHFGPMVIAFALRAVNGDLVLQQLGTTLAVGPWRLPLPYWASPQISAREEPQGPSQIKVAVKVAAPGLGMLVTYDGVIVVEGPRE